MRLLSVFNLLFMTVLWMTATLTLWQTVRVVLNLRQPRVSIPLGALRP